MRLLAEPQSNALEQSLLSRCSRCSNARVLTFATALWHFRADQLSVAVLDVFLWSRGILVPAGILYEETLPLLLS